MFLRLANLISAWLAVWADPDNALELAFFTTGIGAAESVCVDGGAAASATLVVSAEDIGGFPGAPHTGSHAHGGISIRPHDAVGDVHDLFH